MSYIPIKPLTVNQCWQGKRFKTPAYRRYEEDVLKLLPKLVKPTGMIKLILKFGVSSKLSDIDNPVKPFVDILQKKYGFNDRDVYKLIVEKEIVKKGDEYIVFYFESIKQAEVAA